MNINEIGRKVKVNLKFLCRLPGRVDAGRCCDTAPGALRMLDPSLEGITRLCMNLSKATEDTLIVNHNQWQKEPEN